MLSAQQWTSQVWATSGRFFLPGQQFTVESLTLQKQSDEK